MIKAIPRRPLDDDNPNGYVESDADYLANNNELAVLLLDKEVARQAKASKAKMYTQYRSRFEGSHTGPWEVRDFDKPLTSRTAWSHIGRMAACNDAFRYELVEPIA